MGTMKDKNGKDLIEGEGIKKRWQEYTQELCNKKLNNPDNHNGVVIQPEWGVLEYDVSLREALLSAKPVEAMEFQ